MERGKTEHACSGKCRAEKAARELRGHRACGMLLMLVRQCMFMCIAVCMFVCVYLFVCVCVCLCVCVCVCVCMCVCFCVIVCGCVGVVRVCVAHAITSMLQ